MTRQSSVHELQAQVRRLVLTAQRLRVAVAADLGVGVSELLALGHLTDAGELTPKDLATRLRLTTGTVTALTDRLVEAGYASRAPNPADRRSILLRPTSAGSRARTRAQDDFEALIGSAVADWPQTTLAEINEAMAAISGRIEAALSTTAGAA